MIRKRKLGFFVVSQRSTIYQGKPIAGAIPAKLPAVGIMVGGIIGRSAIRPAGLQ